MAFTPLSAADRPGSQFERINIVPFPMSPVLYPGLNHDLGVQSLQFRGVPSYAPEMRRNTETTFTFPLAISVLSKGNTVLELFKLFLNFAAVLLTAAIS